MNDWLESAVIVTVIAGVFSLVTRLLESRWQKARIGTQNTLDDANAAKAISEAYEKFNMQKDEMLQSIREQMLAERMKCQQDIHGLRIRYSEDIERLNGDRDRLQGEVDELKSEIRALRAERGV